MKACIIFNIVSFSGGSCYFLGNMWGKPFSTQNCPVMTHTPRDLSIIQSVTNCLCRLEIRECRIPWHFLKWELSNTTDTFIRIREIIRILYHKWVQIPAMEVLEGQMESWSSQNYTSLGWMSEQQGIASSWHTHTNAHTHCPPIALKVWKPSN